MRIVNQNWNKPRKGATPALKKFANEAKNADGTVSVRTSALNIVTLYGVFVQAGTGLHIRDSLAKLVAIDASKRVICNLTFLPIAPITDYRTAETSLTAKDFKDAKSVADIRKDVQPLLVNKVLGFNTQRILNQLGIHMPSRRILDLNHSYYGSVIYDRGVMGLDALLRMFCGVKYSADPIDKARLIYELYVKRQNTWYKDIANYYQIVQKKVDPTKILDKAETAAIPTYENDPDRLDLPSDEDHVSCSGSDSYSDEYSYSESG